MMPQGPDHYPLLWHSWHTASTLVPSTSWSQHGCSISCIPPAFQARKKGTKEGKRYVLKASPCLKNLLETISAHVLLATTMSQAGDNGGWTI